MKKLKNTIRSRYRISIGKGIDSLIKSETFTLSVLNNSPNPIFVCDLNNTILYVNPALKKLTGFSSKELIGTKPPFPWWPKNSVKKLHKVLKTGLKIGLKKEEILFSTKHQEPFWVEVTGTTVRENGVLLYYVGNWVDITDRKQAELELLSNEKELKIKTANLEELNIALNVLLKKRDKDKSELEERVLFNMRELIIPYLKKLENSGLNEIQNVLLEVLESNLKEIVSPFSKRLSFDYFKFTPTEIQVADLVRQGRNSKEIAKLMYLSTETIAFHRKNIRKKIGITREKVNLRTHLLYINGSDSPPFYNQ